MRYTALLLLLVLLACSKDDDEITGTQIGANTCECTLNGKPWKFNIEPNTVSTIGPRVFWFTMSPDSIYLSFVLRGYQPTTGVTYNINNGRGWSSFYYDGHGYSGYHTEQNTATIRFVKFDTANSIMSGRMDFYFKAPADSTHWLPEMRLRNCWFDVRYLKIP